MCNSIGMSTKKQLLDPLGSMCKLIALKFKKLNTKISIIDHVITLDEPNKILGVELQGAKRWWYSQEQEDIQELYYVVVRLIKWYVISEGHNDDPSEDHSEDPIENNGEDDISKSEELPMMIEYLCVALSKLQKTYKSGLVIFALQFFINLLREALEGNLTLEKLEERRLPMLILENEKEYDNLIDYDKLKKLWKLGTLKKICELYNDCFKVKYDKDIPKKTKKALIEGYLTGITSTLDIIDKDFQLLISNSTKG